MAYNSIEFIIFLILSVVAYYVIGFINKKTKRTIIPQWVILLLSSLIFIGYNNYLYILFIFISSFITWVSAFFVEHEVTIYSFRDISCVYTKKVKSRATFELLLTSGTIFVNLMLLLGLYYYNPLFGKINSIFNTSFPMINLIIPLGISFYTLSLISYSLAIHKRRYDSEKNFFKFFLFVTYFPKLLQGPIMEYNKFSQTGIYDNNKFTKTKFLNSFYRISIGLVKMIIVANITHQYVNMIYDNYLNVAWYYLVLGSVLFSLELYAMLSGLCDVGIGVSGLFGIKLPESFDNAYSTKSIKAFINRWNKPLVSWLQMHIIYPLKNRKNSLLRVCILLMVFALLFGVWFGAGFNFIALGIYLGLLLVIEKLTKPLTRKLKRKLKINKNNVFYNCFLIIKNLLLISFGLIFFRSESLKDALMYMKNMFTLSTPANAVEVFEKVNISPLVLIVVVLSILIISLISVFNKHKDKLSKKINNFNTKIYWLKYIFTCLFFIGAIALTIYSFYIGGGELSFIYFDL